jgi:hypothetical protein
MKRLLLIACAGITAACSVASSPTAPVTTSGGGGFVDSAAGTPGSPSPCPTPAPPAFAVFGHKSVAQECGATGPSNVVAFFKIRPEPASGPAPLQVNINMCQSFDTDPTVDLHYRVDFGDGNNDQGFCRLGQVYATPGVFTATACVWDRIPAHAPGTCRTFTINVGIACAATFSNPRVDCNTGNELVDALTVGGPGCGTPLRANLAGTTGLISSAAGNCAPGTSCTLAFPNPNFYSGPASVTATNALGGFSFILNSGC